MAKEKTVPQVVAMTSVAEGILSKKPQALKAYQLYRAIREDPTVALVRSLILAPVLASEWSVESNDDAPDGAEDLISRSGVPMREHIQQTAMNGCMDFGWQGYEKVIDDSTGDWVIGKLKPLLQDLTDILVDESTGAFLGFQQDEVQIGVEDCLLMNFEVEGTDWYGRSQYESVRVPYLRWLAVDAGCERYEKRVAGSHWVVKYPVGMSKVDGELMDNGEVAKRILNMLEASGKVAIPRQAADAIEEMQQGKGGDSGWDIELLTDSGAGATTFMDRLKYLDTLKVRGMGVPERAVLEGQFGTKAEAGVHGDFAITNIEMKHKRIVQTVNWHVVNQVLRLNYGKQFENTVWVKAAPLNDDVKRYLASVYDKILMSPEAATQELAEIDGNALRDRLGVPSMPETQGALTLPGTEP